MRYKTSLLLQSRFLSWASKLPVGAGAKQNVLPFAFFMRALIMNGFFQQHLLEKVKWRNELQACEEKQEKTFVPEIRITNLNLYQCGGYPEVLQSLGDYVLYLQHPELFIKKGLSPLKGLLLSGASGTGKKMLAEALAGQANVPYIALSAYELLFLDNGEKNLRELFQFARKNAPVVICIKEMEAIGMKQSDKVSLHTITLLNALFAEMSKKENERIVIVGITSRPEVLDPELMQPGRFDRHVVVPLPNKSNRLEILKIHTQAKLIDPEIDLDEFASLTSGFSGAKLAAWVNEAALVALKENSNTIKKPHFDQAREMIQYGTRGRSNPNLRARTHIAIHEVGHAFVSYALGHKLYKISVRPVANFLGYCEFITSDSRLTKRAMEDLICRALAGRAAENIFNITQLGAEDDFERAKSLASYMVCKEGMGQTLLGIQEELEVEKILRLQMKRASNYIAENKELIKKAVSILVQHEELYGDEIASIFEGNPYKKKHNKIDPDSPTQVTLSRKQECNFIGWNSQFFKRATVGSERSDLMEKKFMRL